MMGNQVLASWGWPGATDCDVDHTNSFFIEFLRQGHTGRGSSRGNQMELHLTEAKSAAI